MSHRDEILKVANELAARGTTPTTALVKARLTPGVPMAELLSVLAHWKQSQQQGVTLPIEESSQAPATEPAATEPAATGESVEQRLSRIEAKLDTLIALLSRG
jgi:hypothetical protein